MVALDHTEHTEETYKRRGGCAAHTEGDIEVFGILLDRYEQKLSRYGKKFLSRKEDIEDIVQDVFVSAYQNIQSFDSTQRWSPWIYRIAHNALVNALRKKGRSPIRLTSTRSFLILYIMIRRNPNANSATCAYSSTGGSNASIRNIVKC